MSYFNSLNSFRDAQQQISQHSQDLEQQNQDAKAQSIQDKFDFVDKVINESAGGLGGLGGGFHIARRVYKKIQKTKKDAQDAIDKAKDLKDKLQGKKEGETGENQGSETPAEEPKTEAPKQEMTGDGEDVEGVEGKMKEFSQAETKTQDVPEGGDAKPSEMTKDAPEPPDEPKPTEDFPEAPKPPATEESNIGESQDGGLRVKQDPGNENVSNEGAQNDLNAKGAKPDDKPSGSEADHPETSDSMVDGAENKAVGGGLKDTAETGLEDGVKAGVKDGVNTALEGAGEALDFLGPIGEIFGAGIAIVGFFRDLFEHKKIAKEKAAATSGGAVAGTSGISMTSLSSGGQQSNQIGTLV